MNYLESMNYGGQYPSPQMQNQYGGNIAAGAGAAQQQMQTPGGMQSPALTGWQKFGYVMDGIDRPDGLVFRWLAERKQRKNARKV